ncbi:MAG: ferritin-like domain-containing protein [Planctomycetota bacterium]|nr:MAG: ferritin-like domain-containing protein [Planctomycetota bacterium]
MVTVQAHSIWQDSDDVLDRFFALGNQTWPDLEELRAMKFDRSKVPDKVVEFIRSTALNEYGVGHYTMQYRFMFGEDYKLQLWSAFWAAEEYNHYVVLRRILEAMGEELSAADRNGVEGIQAFRDGYTSYYDRIAVPGISRKVQVCTYGVIQEHAAVVAYNSVCRQLEDPNLIKLLKRIAKDESRHCQFYQAALEGAVADEGEEQRAKVWPQFEAFFNDFSMPQEFIDIFDEKEIGTDLYTSFWSDEEKAKMVLFLTRFFRKFREPAAVA